MPFARPARGQFYSRRDAGYAAVSGVVPAARFARSAYYRMYAKKAKPYRKRQAKKYVRYTKPKVSTQSKLARQVRILSKKIDGTLATYIKKYRSFASVRASATNANAFDAISLAGCGVLEGVIDAVKYYDPTAPTTLVSANLLTGSYKKSIQFKKMHFTCMAKNNYVIPCYVDIYMFMPKADTSIVPETAMTNSLADSSNVAYTSPLIFPSDCYQLMDIWKIVKHKRMFLAPGAQCEVTFSHNSSFNYDPSLVDSEAAEYQKRYGGYSGLIRVSGVLGHDSVTAQVTNNKAGVDVQWTRIHTVVYDAGIDTTYIEVDDNPGTIANTLQVTNMDTQQETYAL